MAADRDDIRRWLTEGVQRGATHLIVACDTFDWEDYPIYVMPGQDVHKIHDEHDGKNMQSVMEVYNLKLDLEEQLRSPRVFNF